MDPRIIAFGLIFASYLLGSIPPSYIIGKIFFKTDIRKQGSGNVGGANSIRLFGKKVGGFVGAFDIFKGTAAVLMTEYYIDQATTNVGFFARGDNIIALAAFAAILGHCFSIFLKFSGGKGGATTWGVLIGIDPFSFFIVIGFWIIVVISTRFTSLGNLAMSFAIPLTLDLRTDKTSYITLGYAIAALLWFKHRENVGRLFRGEERKFGQKEAVA